MFIIGIAFWVVGYTLAYYGIGMATQYSDSSGHAHPTAIPLSVLTGITGFNAANIALTPPHPPFKVGGKYTNGAEPSTSTGAGMGVPA